MFSSVFLSESHNLASHWQVNFDRFISIDPSPLLLQTGSTRGSKKPKSHRLVLDNTFFYDICLHFKLFKDRNWAITCFKKGIWSYVWNIWLTDSPIPALRWQGCGLPMSSLLIGEIGCHTNIYPDWLKPITAYLQCLAPTWQCCIAKKKKRGGTESTSFCWSRKFQWVTSHWIRPFLVQLTVNGYFT